jgi:hypothetical protein
MSTGGDYVKFPRQTQHVVFLALSEFFPAEQPD